MHTNYNWAVNKMKLAASVKHLTDAKKLNPTIVIDEETVKAEYIRRAGLIDEPLKPRVQAPKVVPLRLRTVEELEKLAEEKGIDISKLEKKSDLVKALEEAK